MFELAAAPQPAASATATGRCRRMEETSARPLVRNLYAPSPAQPSHQPVLYDLRSSILATITAYFQHSD